MKVLRRPTREVDREHGALGALLCRLLSRLGIEGDRDIAVDSTEDMAKELRRSRTKVPARGFVHDYKTMDGASSKLRDLASYNLLAGSLLDRIEIGVRNDWISSQRAINQKS